MSNDNWELLDELMAVIRRNPCAADETVQALSSCLVKVIVAAGAGVQDVECKVEAASRYLASGVDFELALAGSPLRQLLKKTLK